MEGSLWVYGHTDLTDFYRDRLTLRQIYVRIRALPAEAPLVRLLAAEQEKAEVEAKEREVMRTLAPFQRTKEG